jgi:hypothetical protein
MRAPAVVISGSPRSGGGQDGYSGQCQRETAELMPGVGVELGPAERRRLAGTPLHAITSVHGEAGLRARRPGAPPVGCPAVDRAW